MSRTYVPGTQIEIIREPARGRIKHALFDFDGTISLLREGWEQVMGPVMVEMVCGDTPPTPAIEAEVARVIDETTGVQTIFQMERLVEMVRGHGLVPEDQILDAHGYKEVYIGRLMVPVRERIAKLEAGTLTREDVTLRGVFRFLELLRDHNVTMYVFSGTDEPDVRNEAGKVGAAPFFQEIWGAQRNAEEYSKEKVLQDIIRQHDLHGSEVLICGDGPVEIRNARENGCIALGVASDEVAGHGWNEHKRERLLRAGADLLVPDFTEAERLVDFLFSTSA